MAGQFAPASRDGQCLAHCGLAATQNNGLGAGVNYHFSFRTFEPPLHLFHLVPTCWSLNSCARPSVCRALPFLRRPPPRHVCFSSKRVIYGNCYVSMQWHNKRRLVCAPLGRLLEKTSSRSGRRRRASEQLQPSNDIQLAPGSLLWPRPADCAGA